MQPPVSNLGSLMGQLPSADFLSTAWPARVFHTVASRELWPSFLQSPLWTDLPELERRYRGPFDVSRGDGQYSVTGLSLTGAVRDLGLVVRLGHVESVFPEVTQWLRECERELGVPPGVTRLSVFLNPPRLGLGPHCDPGDHLMFHLAGEKKIRLLANPSGSFVSASHATSYPLRVQDAAQFSAGLPDWKTLPAEAEDVHLEPGSVLLIPRGTYHETESGPEGISVTLVLGINTPSRAEVFLNTLRERLIQSADWRQPALQGATSNDTWAQLLTALAPQLPELDPGRTMNAAQPLQAHDRFVRDPAVQVHFDPQANDVAVHFRSERSSLGSVRLGHAASRVLESLANTTEPRDFGNLVRAFDDWDPESVAALVQLMRRKGALLPVQAPLQAPLR